MKKLLHLFWVYLKISSTTHGGGYAMIGIMERELVENEKLISDEEYIEIISMCQAFPGPIAITSTAFVGYKLYGLSGAISALLGVLLPSAIVILIISSLLVEYHTNPYVEAAISGIDAVVPMLILLAVIKFGAKLKKNAHNIILAIIAIVALEFFNLNPAILIVAYAIYGLIVFRFLCRDK